MSNLQEIYQIRNSVVNKVMIIGYIFGLLYYLTSLTKSFRHVFNAELIAISIAVVALGVVVLIRKRLSLPIKVYTIIVVILMALIIGLNKFGFLISTKAYIILTPIFVSFVLELKKALVSLVLYVLVYAFFGYLYINGIKVLNINANAYVQDINAWLIDLSLIFLTALALLYLSHNYLYKILEKLSVVNSINDDLKYREKRFRYLFEHSFDSVMILNNQEIYDINKSVLDLFGYDREDIIGKNILELSPEVQPDGQRTIDKLTKIFAELNVGAPLFFEWEHKKRGGETFLASVSLAKMELGDVSFSQVLLKDITKLRKQDLELKQYKTHLESLVRVRTEELERANKELTQSNINLTDQRNQLKQTLKQLHETQEKLIESEKMASIGTLTTGVAHEINNPLNYIQSGLYSLQNIFYGKFDDMSVEERASVGKEIMAGMEVGVKRISEIVQGLERFDKKNEKGFNRCNIRIIIEGCLKLLASETKGRIKVETNFPVEEIVIYGSEVELNSMFVNVLSNSIQAIPEKGEIKVSIAKYLGSVRIDIVDNGIGIEKDVLNRIFEPFFTTKEVGEGTGLGLSTVYNIVSNHEGDINVSSSKGIGTTFSILLPLKI